MRTAIAVIFGLAFLCSALCNLVQHHTAEAMQDDYDDLKVYVNINRNTALANALLYQDCIKKRVL